MIVVDSNVLVARNLASVSTHFAEQVEDLDPLWIVPQLWRYEFQNVLAKALWARQVTPKDALVAWKKASSQLAENQYEPDPETVIDLSARHRITAYDANFIALAMEMGVVCVTEDRELQEKFPETAMGMEDFVKLSQAGNAIHEAPAPYRTRNRKRATARNGS